MARRVKVAGKSRLAREELEQRQYRKKFYFKKLKAKGMRLEDEPKISDLEESGA